MIPDTLNKEIDFSKFRVHIYGDFNLPGVDWQSGFRNGRNTLKARKSSLLLNFIISMAFVNQVL